MKNLAKTMFNAVVSTGVGILAAGATVKAGLAVAASIPLVVTFAAAAAVGYSAKVITSELLEGKSIGEAVKAIPKNAMDDLMRSSLVQGGTLGHQLSKLKL